MIFLHTCIKSALSDHKILMLEYLPDSPTIPVLSVDCKWRLILNTQSQLLSYIFSMRTAG